MTEHQTDAAVVHSMEFVAAMTDEELDEWIAQAHADTTKAGTEQHDSDWHQACFCALVVLCQEKNRRTARRMH